MGEGPLSISLIAKVLSTVVSKQLFHFGPAISNHGLETTVYRPLELSPVLRFPCFCGFLRFLSS